MRRRTDNRNVWGAAGESDGTVRSSPGRCGFTPGTRIKTNSHIDKNTHTFMPTLSPLEVHIWLMQPGGRAREDTHEHTHKRQCVTPGQPKLSYLSFITLVFSSLHCALGLFCFPSFRSAVKATAASTHLCFFFVVVMCLLLSWSETEEDRDGKPTINKLF